MKNFILGILVICSITSGIYLLIAGIRKKNHGESNFKIKHLFTKISVEAASRNQLIIEGIIAIASGFLLWFLVCQ